MEVILTEDFVSLGYIGDKVQVKRGYARNFLIPRNIAVEMTSVRAKGLKHQLERIHAKKAKSKKEAEELLVRIQAMVLEFTLKTGYNGKVFGSVSSKDIEEKLQSRGFKIDRRQVRIPEPIKMLGEHVVILKLHSELNAEVKVKVISDSANAEQQPQVNEE